jgi:hypothetical protein
MMVAEISEPVVAVVLCTAVAVVVVVALLSWRKK